MFLGHVVHNDHAGCHKRVSRQEMILGVQTDQHKDKGDALNLFDRRQKAGNVLEYPELPDRQTENEQRQHQHRLEARGANEYGEDQPDNQVCSRLQAVKRHEHKAEDRVNKQGFARMEHFVDKTEGQKRKQTADKQDRTVGAFCFRPADKQMEAYSEQKRKNHEKARFYSKIEKLKQPGVQAARGWSLYVKQRQNVDQDDSEQSEAAYSIQCVDPLCPGRSERCQNDHFLCT